MTDVKARILLVEDDPTLGFVVKDHLEMHGYEVFHAADGETGWQLYMKHNFDMCVLDVILPKRDGIWLAGQIRKKNETVPILLLTAKSMDEDKITGFQSGADDYITKPFNMQELLLRIEVFLKRTKKKEDTGPSEFKIGTFTFNYENLILSNDHERRQFDAERGRAAPVSGHEPEQSPEKRGNTFARMGKGRLLSRPLDGCVYNQNQEASKGPAGCRASDNSWNRI